MLICQSFYFLYYALNREQNKSYRPVPMFTFRNASLGMRMLLAVRNKTNFLSYSVPYRSDGVSDSNLNSDDRKKYEEKLITADGTALPDPYTLIKNWKDNVKLLPDKT